MCIENKMTYNGPKWVPLGLKFLYGTHSTPVLTLCPDSAHMEPIDHAFVNEMLILQK